MNYVKEGWNKIKNEIRKLLKYEFIRIKYEN
jgi:hypothetical protein